MIFGIKYYLKMEIIVLLCFVFCIIDFFFCKLATQSNDYIHTRLFILQHIWNYMKYLDIQITLCG